jgi:hypothetical protein
MQSKVLELLRPSLTDIAPTVTVSGGMNHETRGVGGSGVEKTDYSSGARGRRSDVNSSHGPSATQEVPSTSSDHRDFAWEALFPD